MATKKEYLPNIELWFERLGHKSKDDWFQSALASQRDWLKKDYSGAMEQRFMGVSMAYRNRAWRSWFLEKDLNAFRLNMLHHSILNIAHHARLSAYYAESLEQWILPALLANHLEGIHWHSQHLVPGFNRYNEVPKTAPDAMTLGSYTARGIQFRLVLQADWETVLERAEIVVANPEILMRKADLWDWKFDIAIANGDVKTMEAIVRKLLTPALKKAHDDAYFGAGGLFTPLAMLHLKIARYHGYELDVVSPWIPQEWLDMKPLENPVIFEESKHVDIYEAYKIDGHYWNGPIDYLPLKPRRPGEPPVTFQECWDLLSSDVKKEYFYKNPKND
ncbi:hypothetical protein [Sessilibacter sp. MAH4]